MAFRITREEAVADGIRRIAREQALKAAEIGAEKVSGNDQDNLIHEGRTRCKKLRGLLRLVRPHLGEVYHRENDVLRKASRELSPARDAAILVSTFDGIAQKAALGSDAIETIRDQISKAARHLDDRDCGNRLIVFRQTMNGFGERLVEWPIVEHDFATIEGGLISIYRRGRKSMKVALQDPTDEAWHEWRKRVKDHWYHVRILQNVWKPVMSARAGELDALSDLLGRDHDLAMLKVALGHLESVEIDLLEVVVEVVSKRQSEIRSKSAKLGRRVFAESPKAFRKRIKNYWRAWRV